MSRTTISLPDDLEPHIQRAAGGNVSAWLAGLAREKLMTDACAAIREYEALHDDPEWEAERLGLDA